ncbi:MAG: S24 family peptidase [Hyphomicrobiaceae bacterium]
MTTAKAFAIAAYELTLEQRIAQLVEMVGGQMRAAEIAGVSRTAIHKWRNGQARIPIAEMLLLARAAGVSLDWIATGYDRRPDLPASSAGGFKVLYRYEASLSGKMIEIADNGGTDLALRETWLKEMGMRLDTTGVFEVRDDAMVPTIPEGSLLIADRSVTALTRSGIYAIIGANGIAVRRAQVMLDGTVKLIADNPRYEPEVLSAQAAGLLRIAGRVRAALVTL